MAEQKKKTAKKTAANKDNKKASVKKTSGKALDKITEEEKNNLKKKQIVKSEAISILIIGFGVFFVLAMLTNTCGKLGIAVDNFLQGLFGKIAYVIPFFMIIFGILVFAQKTAFISWRTAVFSLILFILLSSFAASFLPPLFNTGDYSFVLKDFKEIYHLKASSGGVFGVFFGSILLNSLGKTGLYIFCFAGIIICLLFIINTPVSQLFDDLKIKRELRKEKREESKKNKAEITAESNENAYYNKEYEADAKSDNIQDEDALDVDEDRHFDIDAAYEKYLQNNKSDYNRDNLPENKRKILDYVTSDMFGSEKKQSNNNKHSEGLDSENSMLSSDNSFAYGKDSGLKEISDYKFPPIDCLKKETKTRNSKKTNPSEIAAALQKTLDSFGVSARVSNVVQGPVVTRIEVQPAPGVPVSKIVHLQNDIALNLRAKSIRIEAPIPGKAAVGIEVSNETSQTVFLRDLVDSKEFKSTKSKIAVTLGRSIDGENIICDIHEMPHLLIAGTTGSGKSVCIDSMLVSLLYHARPDEVKLILIDPKVVELIAFKDVPHLLIPVVTEPNKAAVALGCAVNEMNERYNKFADEGVKDLLSYNESVRFRGREDLAMPEILIVIDELADLMFSSRNQVETNIGRLAQKARAAGMHLIIATQRPSADIITGVIKANISSRIALKVSSGVDSRVILDMVGAENLLGHGDMLYSPQSLSKPIRIQGSYISPEEVKAVTQALKEQNIECSYDKDILSEMEKVDPSSDEASSDDTDELFMDVLEYVATEQKCSCSIIQRRFRIGYNRAANICDMLEDRGFVGPSEGQKGRKVLITQADFEEYSSRIKELEKDF